MSGESKQKEEQPDLSTLPATAAEADKPIDPNTESAAAPVDTHPSATPSEEELKAGINSPAFYTSLTRWHPGIGYFQFLSNNEFPAAWPPDKRFNACIERHPHIYRACYLIDLIMMVIILIGLGVIAGFIAYKTIS